MIITGFILLVITLAFGTAIVYVLFNLWYLWFFVSNIWTLMTNFRAFNWQEFLLVTLVYILVQFVFRND